MKIYDEICRSVLRQRFAPQTLRYFGRFIFMYLIESKTVGHLIHYTKINFNKLNLLLLTKTKYSLQKSKYKYYTIFYIILAKQINSMSHN